MISHTNKPWGYEELIECNEHYVMKRLFMKSGHCCSLQYHKEKHETIYVLEGVMELTIGDSESNLNVSLLEPGDTVVIPPGIVHRMKGYWDCLYLEASTPQLKDVVRLSDNYGRN